MNLPITNNTTNQFSLNNKSNWTHDWIVTRLQCHNGLIVESKTLSFSFSVFHLPWSQFQLKVVLLYSGKRAAALPDIHPIFIAHHSKRERALASTDSLKGMRDILV